MLPDIGGSELIVIALAALIFVGPKDLPLMLKKLGQFTAKMRRMAADFRSSFDDMARQSELEDLRREVEEMRANASQAISDPIGMDSTLRETIDDMNAATIDDAVGYQEPEPDAEPAAPVAEKPKRVRKPATPKAASPLAEKAGADAKPARARKSAASTSSDAPKPRKRAVAKAAN